MCRFEVKFVLYIYIQSFISIVSSTALCSSVYGATEPCHFVPAPPGKTPPCARPGDTFCEHIEHYPMQHIRYLIDKWGYDYSTLLNDETTSEFSSYFTPPDYSNYGYPNSIPSHPGYTYPEPIYIPKPPSALYSQPLPGNKYIPPAGSNARLNFTEGGQGAQGYQGVQGYPDRRPARYPDIAGLNGYRGRHHGYFMNHGGNGYSGHQLYYDPNSWLRYARDNKNFLSRSKRSAKPAPKIELSTTNSTTNSSTVHHREKRQSTLGGPQQLCPTRSQYITPRAALNNKGNWMYVVNLQEQDNRYTQLVRSESCVSQTCSGLCSVPSGYTARCEQRYVQKRLVALEGAGQNLYTDVFWFPSCCVCTFTQG